MFRLTVIALFFLSSLAFSDPDITNCAAGGLFTSGGVAECVSPKFTEPVVTDLCRANVHGYVYYSGECLEAGGEWDAARNICLFADPARTGEERAQAEEGLIKSAHNECGSQVQELNSEWVTLPSNAWCNTTKLRYMVNGEVLHGAKDFHISVNYYPTYAPNPPQPSDCTGLDNQTLRVQLDRTEACPIGYNRREQTDPQNTENKLVECWKMPEEKPSNSNNEPASPGEGDDEDAPESDCNDANKEDENNYPVNLVSGEKMLVQVDYRHPQGLEFVRYYKSHAHYAPLTDPSDQPFMMGVGWSSTYDRRVFPADGSTGLLGSVLHPDGTITYFKLDGSEFQNTDTYMNKLVKLVDGSGNVTGWEYTNNNDDVENYDATGKLLTITSKAGRQISISYDANGKISAASDDLGNSLVFSYNGLGRMVSMQNPAGQIYRYAYYDGYRPGDSSSIYHAIKTGALAAIFYPDGTPLDDSDNPNRVYLYHGGPTMYLNLLAGIQDESGQRFSTYLYDYSNGDVLASFHGTGFLRPSDPSYQGSVRNDFTYQNGKISAVADELGNVVNLLSADVNYVKKGLSRSAPVSGCDGRTLNRTYDGDGNVASRTFFGGKTASYLYDSKRRVTSRTEAAGSSDELVVTTDWHSTWNLPTKITKPGLEISYSYDPNSGNETSRVLKDLNTNETLTWTTSYTYSSAQGVSGLIVQKVVDGPIPNMSDQTTYYYYDATESCAGGHNGCKGQLKQIKNALNQSIFFDKYSANGQLEEMTDMNGVVTTIDYSPRGWPTSISKGAATTTYEYYPTGLIKKVTLPDSDWVQYDYNDAHELVGIQNHKSESIDIDKSIDSVAHKKTVISSFKSSSSQEVKKLANVLGRNELLFEKLGNNGQQVEYVYDSGNRIKEVLQYGFGAANDVLLTEYERNQNTGLIEKEYLPKKDGANVRGTGDFINYGYDVNRRLTSISNVNDSTTSRHTFTYDGFGRLVNEWSPQAGNTNYFYNTSGQLYKKILAAGSGSQSVIRYQYDSLGRLTKMGHGVTVTWTHEWHYDDATAGNYGIGRLAYVTDPSGRADYQYDDLGRIVSEQRQMNIPGGGTVTTTTGFAYSPGGHLTQVTYPGGRVINYTQTNGDVTAVATQSGAGARTIYSGIGYQAFGGWNQITFPEYGNDYVLRTFDLDGRLQKWEVLESGAVPTELYRNYTYDKFNNIASITYGNDPVLNQVFSYDEQQRLLAVQNQQGIWGYSYKNASGIDTLGDRTRRTLQRIDPATGLGAQVGGQPYYVLDEGYGYTNNRLMSVTRDVKQYPCNASDPSRTGTPAIPCDEPSNVRSMTYDTRGNLVTDDRGDDQGITLQYDIYGRVVQVSGMQE